MEPLFVVLIVFFAIFTQSVSGFGLALVSMPLLTELLGIQVAAPLVALEAIVAETLLVWLFRQALNLQVVWRLVLASLLGVPLGVLALKRVEEGTILAVLGVIVVGYALYGLLNFPLPRLDQPAWAYILGFAAGALGGAYNIAGPPVVIYGHCRRWPPAEFKGNLQGYFVVVSAIIVAGHLWGGDMTADVWRNFPWVLLGTGLGVVLGLWLERYINPALFRRLVLLLLIVLGLRLIL